MTYCRILNIIPCTYSRTCCPSYIYWFASGNPKLPMLPSISSPFALATTSLFSMSVRLFLFDNTATNDTRSPSSRFRNQKKVRRRTKEMIIMRVVKKTDTKCPVCIYTHLFQFRLSVMSDSLWPHGLQQCQASLSVHRQLYHQLPEFTQTHVYWVSDAIQPSHPLSPNL